MNVWRLGGAERWEATGVNLPEPVPQIRGVGGFWSGWGPPGRTPPSSSLPGPRPPDCGAALCVVAFTLQREPLKGA